jgi:hypothetical protein
MKKKREKMKTTDGFGGKQKHGSEVKRHGLRFFPELTRNFFSLSSLRTPRRHQPLQRIQQRNRSKDTYIELMREEVC